MLMMGVPSAGPNMRLMLEANMSIPTRNMPMPIAIARMPLAEIDVISR